MEYRYDAPCGIYCGACAALNATREGSLEKLAKQVNEDPAQLKCAGCKTDVNASYCDGCFFRDCAAGQGFEFCFECEDYPCEPLAAFRRDKWPHHSRVLKNLAEIQELGLDVWLEQRAKRWSCPECGKGFTWYDAKCEKCGAELYDCRAEDEDLAREIQLK